MNLYKLTIYCTSDCKHSAIFYEFSFLKSVLIFVLNYYSFTVYEFFIVLFIAKIKVVKASIIIGNRKMLHWH